MLRDQALAYLIGKPITDDRVRRLMEFAGVGDRKIKIRRGESDASVDCPLYGLVFNFEEASETIGKAEGTLVLSAIHAMAEGVKGHKQFSGELPVGLSFSMSQNEVERILGSPDWVSLVLPIYRWNKIDIRIVVEFFDEKPLSIASVVIQQPR